MERIGLISKDIRLKTELGRWIEDLPGEFELVELGPPSTADPALNTKDTTDSTVDPDSAEPSKPVLIIFDSACGLTLSKIRNELAHTEIPWLAIGLEEHARNPHDPIIIGANDLILAPLDRSVFLQKMEYLLAGDASVTPSFLFLAKADLPIELAKPVHITHISETGCTISSPRPVAQGVEGTLISKLFGLGNDGMIEVRAVESTPYFESSIATAGTSSASDPRFDVKLRFFGMRHKQLQELRRWIAAHLPHGMPEITRSEHKPDSIPRFALITPQSSNASLLNSALEKLTQFELNEFQGFKRFWSSLQNPPAPLATSVESLAPNFALAWSKEFVGPRTKLELIPALPHTRIEIDVRTKTEQLPNHVERITPALSPNETLLFANKDAWARDLSPLTNGLAEVDRESFDEAVEWVLSNSKNGHHPEMRITVPIEASPAHRFTMTLTLKLAEEATPARAALLRVSLEEAVEPVKAAGSSKKEDIKGSITYEAILIDATLLAFDLKLKILSVADWLEKSDLKNGFGNRPPLIVFNAKEDLLPAHSLRGTPVQQLVYDFVDRRYNAELFISMSRPEMWSSPQLAVAGLKTDLSAFLARPARTAGVSEVSLNVVDRVPMKRGSELLIFSPLWSQAPEGIWARVRSASPKGEGQFINEFVFFGASDLVQKEIRKFTREDYIKKKAQGQS